MNRIIDDLTEDRCDGVRSRKEQRGYRRPHRVFEAALVDRVNLDSPEEVGGRWNVAAPPPTKLLEAFLPVLGLQEPRLELSFRFRAIGGLTKRP